MRRTTSASALQFERTRLWKNTFENPDYKGTDACEFYASRVRDLREKVRVLVDRIRVDIPFLTVHDITHLDALWELGSLIAGPDYRLSPAEGFVFGSAILLHDAAMCVAAFPGGIVDLKRTTAWRDTVTLLMRDTESVRVSDAVFENPPPDVTHQAIPVVLRMLHAQHAEELPRIKWRTPEGDDEYLIDSGEIREFYGRLIGRVARSHGESLGWVDKNVERRLGPLPVHDGGEVEALKLACLLRVADAAHLDSRRAPRFERTILAPQGDSKLHWSFQRKLAKPQPDRGALLFTSGSDFTLSEADSWWLCFDSVQVVDRELRDCDAALEGSGLPRFRIRKVRGAETAKAFGINVRTVGWEPIDAQVRVSDVPRLVGMFGGERLYGADRTAAIRELMQNAADAIRARRCLQPNFAKVGEIVVSIDQIGDEWWLSVEDNGIGMSERTMTETLLDFGTSFWTSTAAQQEFPGLIAKGVSPTGKFGIGFFSVFMLGTVVKVTSQRYDTAASATRVLEFRGGLKLRPILRHAEPGELIEQGGSKIAVQLATPPFADGEFLAYKDWLGDLHRKDLGEVIGTVCPSLDVNVSVRIGNRKKQLLKAHDWLRVKGDTLLSRIRPRSTHQRDVLNLYSEFLRPISDGNRIYGRACIRPDANHALFARVTVGGFSASGLPYVEGVFLGKTEALARNTAELLAPAAALASWAEEQAQLLGLSALSSEEKLTAAGVVIGCCGSPGRLPIAHLNAEFLNIAGLKKILRSRHSIRVYEGRPTYDDDRDDCRRSAFEDLFEAAPEILFLGRIPETTWQRLWFPEDPSYWRILKAILKRQWKFFQTQSIEAVVGEVGGAEITREIQILSRKQLTASEDAVD